VAKVMATTAVDALKNPAIIEKAKADYAERTDISPYVSPLPPDVKPPIRAKAAA
jgi:aminobenzoyl-glutamate utilization protein B